ncbi:MAG: DUF5683 domain-containing protein [Bacteroidota bacterium]
MKGSVHDVSSGEAIRGAEIYVKGTKSGTLTDIAGFFSLKLPSPPPYKVSVRAYGYQEQEIDIKNIEVENHILLYPRSQQKEKIISESLPSTLVDSSLTQDSIPQFVDSLRVDSLALKEGEVDSLATALKDLEADSLVDIVQNPQEDSLASVSMGSDSLLNAPEAPKVDSTIANREKSQGDSLLSVVELLQVDTLGKEDAILDTLQTSSSFPKSDSINKPLSQPRADSLADVNPVAGNDSIPSFMGRTDATGIPGFISGQKPDSIPQNQAAEKLTFSQKLDNFKKDLPRVHEKNEKYRLTVKIPWQKKSYDIPFPKGFTKQPNPPPYDPAVAWQRSLIFPGWGQAYNRSYWKIPFFYAGYGGFVWWINFNNVRYRRFGTAYLLEIDNIEGNEDEELSARFDPSGLRTQRNQYRSRRDNAYLLLAGWHVIQMVEAYVHAHLRGFDVSNDLSMKVVPDMLELPSGGLGSSYYPGLSLKFKF